MARLTRTVSTTYSRRQVLRMHGAAALAAVCSACSPPGARRSAAESGCVVGEATGEAVGMRVLADGGNAVDAVVAAALTAAVAAPANTGIGGYGLSAIVACDGGRRIIAVDGNSAAPAAMSSDIFQPGSDGTLPPGISRSNWLSSTGWLSAGVPGILAGLQRLLDEFGSRGFGDLVQPAIALARSGFPCPAGLAKEVAGREEILRRDPGSRKLFLAAGNPLPAGQPFRNPELADMLDTLAKDNSVEDFYRGGIAQRIADAFQKNGGLVTARDMADYEAPLVAPLAMDWGPYRIHTAPLTAGGLSVLQMLRAMQAMDWGRLPEGVMRSHARIEAMRLAWRDRLSLLGDPQQTSVPVARLMSEEFARESAEKITSAVQTGKLLAHLVTRRDHSGTIHLSAADRHGNFAALTLTHGNAFGACVTVDGLGLTLGHGMSRFDPHPEHPNAPGPRKRPLHNMVPTIVTRNAIPVLAVGGTGGRRIPNGLLEVLTQFVVLRRPLADAIAAPRAHTEGDTALSFEKAWPETETEGLRQLGYSISTAGSATMSAVALEDGHLRKARR